MKLVCAGFLSAGFLTVSDLIAAERSLGTAEFATQLTGNVFEALYERVPIGVEIDTSISDQRTIRIMNLSGGPIYLGGSQVSFNYSGDPVIAVWGTPNVDWNIDQSNQHVILKATVDYAPSLAPKGFLTVTFSGNGAVSNVNFLKPSYKLEH
ncbi:MAG: hypothetical protein ABIQ95_10050 [Bdellovibrionia bacterium]